MARTMSMTTTQAGERISGDPRAPLPHGSFVSVAELGDWLRCATLAVFSPELLLDDERRLTTGEADRERLTAVDWR